MGLVRDDARRTALLARARQAVVAGQSLAAAARALAGAGAFGEVSPRCALAGLREMGTSPASVVALGAARTPDGVAIIDERTSRTWAELHERIGALAAALRDEHGAGPERAVALLCRNHSGFVETLMAATRLGADVLLLNTEFPGPQLAQALERAGDAIVVADDEFAAALDAAGHTGARVLAWPEDPARPSGIDELVARHADHRVSRPSRRSELTILSSGTTGAPRGAARAPTVAAMAGPCASVVAGMGLRRGSPLLIGPPLFHGFGLGFMLIGLLVGCPIVLQRRFDAERVLAQIDAHRVGALVGVPVMLQRMLALGGDAPASLRTIASAGAPLSPQLAAEVANAWGQILCNIYGSTETGIGAFAGPADLRVAPGTVGRPVIGARISVLGEDRHPEPIGATGHIFVGSLLMFDGYSGGGTRETSGGMMNTGDLGHVDEHGLLHIDGREDDMIVSGGENVFPLEVEETLAAHDAVREVAVFGVSDPEFGQRLKAYVVIDGEAEEVDEDALLAHVRARVARYKVPREVEFVEELPRTSTGKVIRAQL